MSYDLMVFNKRAAPVKRDDFLQWYQKQTEWSEDHSYDDPANTSAELRNWFMDMIKEFPAMNGPFASDDENDNVSDYSIGRDVIYVTFAWSVAEQAYRTMFEFASKNGVGFFDASADNGDIYFPAGNGKLNPIENSESNSSGNKKSWWKFW